MGTVALLFISIFFTIILLPCAAVAIIGYQLISKLGMYPSRTPAIQMGVLFKLVVVEVVSLTLMLAFFKILVAE